MLLQTWHSCSKTKWRNTNSASACVFYEWPIDSNHLLHNERLFSFYWPSVGFPCKTADTLFFAQQKTANQPKFRQNYVRNTFLKNMHFLPKKVKKHCLSFCFSFFILYVSKWELGMAVLVVAGARTEVPPGPRWSLGTSTAQLLLGSTVLPWIAQCCIAGYYAHLDSSNPVGWGHSATSHPTILAFPSSLDYRTEPLYSSSGIFKLQLMRRKNNTHIFAITYLLVSNKHFFLLLLILVEVFLWVFVLSSPPPPLSLCLLWKNDRTRLLYSFTGSSSLVTPLPPHPTRQGA